jgi:hypothetical protein
LVEGSIEREVFRLDIDICDLTVFEGFNGRGISSHYWGYGGASKGDKREIDE